MEEDKRKMDNLEQRMVNLISFQSQHYGGISIPGLNPLAFLIALYGLLMML